MNAVGRLRDATADDAEAILDLNLLVDLAEIGEPNSTIDEVLTDLRLDSIVSAVVDDPEGGLLGYSWVERAPGHRKTWGDLIIRPGADGWVGRVMFHWLRAKANEVGPGLPTHLFADSKNTAKNRMYEAAGGTVIRRFYRMGITFDDATTFEVPKLGEGVEIRGVERTDADLRAMHAVIDVAFLDHFAHESETFDRWLKLTAEGIASDLSLWWIATVDGQPAAALYGSELPESGYVDTLGTLREYRGRGLGRALLLTAFREFHRRGARKVVLGVDATNPTGALGLYESVGMKAEHEGLRYELAPFPT
jgi:mycothiol synthase